MTDPTDHLNDSQTDPVVWLDKMAPETAAAVSGAKIGRLAELHQAGIAVPRGFAVTVDAYRRYLSSEGLDAVVGKALSNISAEPAQVEAASAEIRAAFEQTAVPAELSAAITSAYEELCLRCLEINTPVAVRSSATGEDSAAASFAGIFDTYLGMSGPERVLQAVRRCWGSLFTARALAYRHARDISHLEMPIAVGVLELVPARASGVAFSRHPVTGRGDRIVIEGSWGWGEAVVQGLVTPDHVEVGKSDQRVLRYDTAHKTVVSAFDYALGEVTETDMPSWLRDRPALENDHISAVTAAVLAIESHYGYPVDVEWIIGRHDRPGDPVTIVQARPITAGREQPGDEQGTPTWDPVAYAAKYAFGRGGAG